LLDNGMREPRENRKTSPNFKYESDFRGLLGKSVGYWPRTGRRSDLWNTQVLSREWNEEGSMDEQSGESAEEEVVDEGMGESEIKELVPE